MSRRNKGQFTPSRSLLPLKTTTTKQKELSSISQQHPEAAAIETWAWALESENDALRRLVVDLKAQLGTQQAQMQSSTNATSPAKATRTASAMSPVAKGTQDVITDTDITRKLKVYALDCAKTAEGFKTENRRLRNELADTKGQLENSEKKVSELASEIERLEHVVERTQKQAMRLQGRLNAIDSTKKYRQMAARRGSGTPHTGRSGGQGGGLGASHGSHTASTGTIPAIPSGPVSGSNSGMMGGPPSPIKGSGAGRGNTGMLDTWKLPTSIGRRPQTSHAALRG